MPHLHYSVTTSTRRAPERPRRNTFGRTWFAFERQHASLSRKIQRGTFGIIKPGLKTYAFLALAFCAIYMYQTGTQHPERYNHSVEAKIEMPWSHILTGRLKESTGRSEKATPKNAYAPVSSSQLTDAEAQAFIEKFNKLAISEQDRFGIPASISLAQGLVESRAGTSRLARENNNYFGIKCFSKSCTKGHCTNHFDDHHKDFFIKFKTPWESWRAHSKLLVSARYAVLKKHGKDYRAWAEGLQKLGYATDRQYAEKLIGMIEKYRLHEFDDI